MALHSSLVRQPPHLLTRADGAVMDADLIRHAHDVESLFSMPSGTVELVDLRGADLRGVTGAGVRHLAELAASSPQRPSRLRRVAVLVDSDLSFGLARMYQAHLADTTTAVSVFRDEPEARDWLFRGDSGGTDTQASSAWTF